MEAYLADMEAAGVDVSRVRVLPDARTPISTIIVSPLGRMVVPYYDHEMDADTQWFPVEQIEGFTANPNPNFNPQPRTEP